MSNEHVNPIFKQLLDDFDKTIPDGFGPIFCKNHPDREAVPPMAIRLCEECQWNNGARLAERDRKRPWREPDQYTDGRISRDGYGNVIDRPSERKDFFDE